MSLRSNKDGFNDTQITENNKKRSSPQHFPKYKCSEIDLIPEEAMFHPDAFLTDTGTANNNDSRNKSNVYEQNIFEDDELSDGLHQYSRLKP